VIFGLDKHRTGSGEFLARLAERHVLAVPVDAHHVRMVTHLDVNRSDIEAAATAVEEVMV
jgi:threonine aldolase